VEVETGIVRFVLVMVDQVAVAVAAIVETVELVLVQELLELVEEVDYLMVKMETIQLHQLVVMEHNQQVEVEEETDNQMYILGQVPPTAVAQVVPVSSSSHILPN
tara:strand:- start:39 stop:353 length:315 start_codon:yes stop_codon:yes gene_type:complete